MYTKSNYKIINLINFDYNKLVLIISIHYKLILFIYNMIVSCKTQFSFYFILVIYKSYQSILSFYYSSFDVIK